MVEPFSLEAFRAELKQFAEESIRAELMHIQDNIIKEIRVLSAKEIQTASAQVHDSHSSSNEEVEAPARLPAKLAKEASHGMFKENSGQGMEGSNRALTLEGMAPGNGERERQPQSFKTRKSMRMSYLPVAHKPFAELTPFERIQRHATDVVISPFFENITAIVVIVNAAYIGIQTDYQARNWVSVLPTIFVAIDWAFVVLAIAELTVRIVASGSAFFYKTGWKWNWFDFIVGGTQLIDVSLSCLGSSVSNNAALRSLRLFKLVRILRIARIATVFPELHVLISSIVDSLYSLVWVLVLILSFLYAVAICITDLVNEHKLETGKEVMEEHQEALLEYFDTMDTTMISLYMIISEGIHWGELVEPLAEHITPWMRLVFVIFVGFQLFAMMNVITACFVDNAMKIATKAERDEVLSSLRGLMAEGALYRGHGDDEISEEVFHASFDQPGMTRFLDLAGCDNDDPVQVYKVIDEHAAGILSTGDFMKRCGNLIGSSSAMQVAASTAEIKALLKQEMTRLEDSQKKQFEAQKSQFEALAKAAEKTNSAEQKTSPSSSPVSSPRGGPAKPAIAKAKAK